MFTSEVNSNLSNMELIWTNPSPTSNFGAQTLSLDLSAYKYLVIYSRFSTSDDQSAYKVNCLLEKGDDVTQYIVSLDWQQHICNSRKATFNDNGVTFANGNVNSTANSAVCIPLYIYGIK